MAKTGKSSSKNNNHHGHNHHHGGHSHHHNHNHNHESKEGDGEEVKTRRRSMRLARLAAAASRERAVGRRRVADENLGTIESEVTKAKYERVAVWALRLLVCSVLSAVAVAICWTVYRELYDKEEDDFEREFQAAAETLVDGFQRLVIKRSGLIQDFGQSITSYIVQNEQNNKTTFEWPFVIIPDYQFAAESVATLGEFLTLGLFPRLHVDQRERWETNFTVDNMDWYKDAASVNAYDNANNFTAEDLRDQKLYPPLMTKATDNGIALEDGSGPDYYPLWQQYPAGQATYNMNYLTYPFYRPTLTWILQHKVAGATPAFDFWNPIARAHDPRRPVIADFARTFQRRHGGLSYDDDPISPFFFPVFRRLDSTDEIMGFLGIIFYWKTFLRGLLPSTYKGVTVVIRNTCNQVYSYQVDGPEALFVGHDDVHDPQFEHLVVVESQADDNNNNKNILDSSSTKGPCLYSLNVYPSEDFYNEYKTNKPLVLALCLGSVFWFASIFFVLYDYRVSRRQEQIERTAERSHNIVSNLFPDQNVRNRIYKEQEMIMNSNINNISGHFSHNSGHNSTPGATNEFGQQLQQHGSSNASSREAIANEYPDCTVMIADIVAFTQWSAHRSPSQVFELLETAFGALDNIAERWTNDDSGIGMMIRTIETVGDCYVAVAGLPQPCPNHAVVMSAFAQECHRTFRDLVHGESAARFDHKDNLVTNMNNDKAEVTTVKTTDLSLRIGLHSGPVTGGVVRGLRERFQIFGPTPTMASYLEGTGLPGRTHASEQTALLLDSAGKKRWVFNREEKIPAPSNITTTSCITSISTEQAKQIQTYWIDIGDDDDTKQRLTI